MKEADASRAFAAVLKVGGSLARGEGLPALARAIGELGRQHELLVVPGGGVFADAVREQYARYRLGETAAHRMALLAMDQYGLLLAELIPGSALVPDLLAARGLAAAGRAPVLLPAALLTQADPLPHSWQVTSDSLGAWLAGLAGARRYVLLKDVDGLYPADPRGGAGASPYAELSRAELRAGLGGVDDYLASALAALPELETWAINGNCPERLGELLASGRTLGTRIV